MPLPEPHRRILVRVALGSLVASFVSFGVDQGLHLAGVASAWSAGAFPPTSPQPPDLVARVLAFGDFLAPAALLLLLVLVATRSLSEEERGGVETALLLLLAGMVASFVLPRGDPADLLAASNLTPLLALGALVGLAWNLPRARAAATAGAILFGLRIVAVPAAEWAYVRASGDAGLVPLASALRLAPPLLGALAALLLALAFLPGTLHGRLAPVPASEPRPESGA